MLHLRYGDQDVAIKKFRIATSADLERYRSELLILSRLNHPNVVKLVGAKCLPPDYMLVLPLETSNLGHMLYHQAWRPNWRQLLTIAVDLVDGLAHVHNAGVIHR